jgi:hypothetical protein
LGEERLNNNNEVVEVCTAVTNGCQHEDQHNAEVFVNLGSFSHRQEKDFG